MPKSKAEKFVEKSDYSFVAKKCWRKQEKNTINTTGKKLNTGDGLRRYRRYSTHLHSPGSRFKQVQVIEVIPKDVGTTYEVEIPVIQPIFVYESVVIKFKDGTTIPIEHKDGTPVKRRIFKGVERTSIKVKKIVKPYIKTIIQYNYTPYYCNEINKMKKQIEEKKKEKEKEKK